MTGVKKYLHSFTIFKLSIRVLYYVRFRSY